jgi:hypothetical protein
MNREALSKSYNDINTTEDRSWAMNVQEFKFFVFEIAFDFLNLFLTMLGQNHM